MQTTDMITTLNDALDGFGLDAHCVNAMRRRHFGFYDIRLGPKCQISRIQRLATEIQLKIRSKNAPIVKTMAEEGLVRLQVVVSDPEPIDLGDLFLANPERPKGFLPFLLGEMDDGKPLWADMAQNPHMLVAGSTGSGKSVVLQTLIANAARTYGMELYLVDPKCVEFAAYRDVRMSPLVKGITTSYQGTLHMLQDLVDEMSRRYETMMELGYQSIEQMPAPFRKIMVIIDEVSDLILMDGRTHRFEELLVKLAQKCRAAGIYLVLATQRPSVDVLTGLIKANFEGRLACRVSSNVDSRVILDHPGAENLIGKGDAIFKNRIFNSVRFQVAYTTSHDVVSRYLKNSD